MGLTLGAPALPLVLSRETAAFGARRRIAAACATCPRSRGARASNAWWKRPDDSDERIVGSELSDARLHARGVLLTIVPMMRSTSRGSARPCTMRSARSSRRRARSGQRHRVLTGAGGRSRPGATSRACSRSSTTALFSRRRHHREADRCFRSFDLEKPLIAKINGHAVGLGRDAALFCDVTVHRGHREDRRSRMSRSAWSRATAARHLAAGSSFRRAKEFLMTGAPARRAAPRRSGWSTTACRHPSSTRGRRLLRQLAAAPRRRSAGPRRPSHRAQAHRPCADGPGQSLRGAHRPVA